jgi:hypothetical protein
MDEQLTASYRPSYRITPRALLPFPLPLLQLKHHRSSAGCQFCLPSTPRQEAFHISHSTALGSFNGPRNISSVSDLGYALSPASDSASCTRQTPFERICYHRGPDHSIHVSFRHSGFPTHDKWAMPLRHLTAGNNLGRYRSFTKQGPCPPGSNLQGPSAHPDQNTVPPRCPLPRIESCVLGNHRKKTAW